MREYNILQWILFFFIYSFIGWIWESCYVSLKERRPVNRGFMHGPFLPLYGSGAVVVLVCTMGVRENPALIFLMGMAGATVLEYITGAVMEWMFHVKYWDYSKQKFNLNGYICPLASLCWGCFSVLMADVIHPPVERTVLMLPREPAAVTACVLAGGAAVDFTISFKEALDMKKLLAQVEKSRAQIRCIQEKLRQTADEITDSYKNRFESKREAQKAFRKSLYLERFIRESIRRELQEMNRRSDKRYLRIVKILRRNPTAVSAKFKETLDELKHIINGR